MSLSKLDSLCISEGAVDGEFRDFFPLLVLPPELIDRVLSFLSVEDRMRSRVNKKLNKIESESRCYVRKLRIFELPIGAPLPSHWKTNDQNIVFREGRSYSTDIIKKLIHNTSVGGLSIKLTGSGNFQREIYNLIKDFTPEELILDFGNQEMEKEIMVESYILDWAKKCNSLSTSFEFITHETMHMVYKMMFDDSSKIRVFGGYITGEKFTTFLKLIDIFYRDSTLFSSKAIEGFLLDNGRAVIFDGFLEILFSGDIFVDFGLVCLKAHRTQESLEKAKKRMVVIDVE